MSSENAKLNLVADKDAGEALREMGYEPEHVEGTPTEQAKAMLEEARAELDEAHHLMEEDTLDWEIVGTACDELDCIIGQMWPTDGGIQWQDSIAPMWHAVSCLTFCREIAVYGDQDAPSTGFVCGAAASLNKAATLLWGDKFTTAFDSRRDEADQRKAAATFEDGTDETTDEDRDHEDTAERIRELAEDIHNNELTIFDMNDMESMGEANMADARAKARSYEARDETEAAEFAANVADGINRVAVTCAYASCTPGIDEGMRETLEKLAKKAKMMLVETVSVCNHLNGHKTAESDGDAR